jgi:hypothetical protein
LLPGSVPGDISDTLRCDVYAEGPVRILHVRYKIEAADYVSLVAGPPTPPWWFETHISMRGIGISIIDSGFARAEHRRRQNLKMTSAPESLGPFELAADPNINLGAPSVRELVYVSIRGFDLGFRESPLERTIMVHVQDVQIDDQRHVSSHPVVLARSLMSEQNTFSAGSPDLFASDFHEFQIERPFGPHHADTYHPSAHASPLYDNLLAAKRDLLDSHSQTEPNCAVHQPVLRAVIARELSHGMDRHLVFRKLHVQIAPLHIQINEQFLSCMYFWGLRTYQVLRPESITSIASTDSMDLSASSNSSSASFSSSVLNPASASARQLRELRVRMPPFVYVDSLAISSFDPTVSFKRSEVDPTARDDDKNYHLFTGWFADAGAISLVSLMLLLPVPLMHFGHRMICSNRYCIGSVSRRADPRGWPHAAQRHG